MDDRHNLAAAIERLRRHFAAKRMGEDPYHNDPSPHDPAMAYTWDADLFAWDSEAVIKDYLARHGGPTPGTGGNSEGI